MSTVLQQLASLSCCLVHLVKRSAQTDKRQANRHWKFVYQRDVLLPLSMVPLLLSFGGVRALSPPILGGDADTTSPN